MKYLLLSAALLLHSKTFSWGFYAHGRINYLAVFLLPPEMMVLYKPQINYLSEHSTDPDKRRYAVKEEAPRHYIDLDRYGSYPFADLPSKWEDAVNKFSEDSLMKHGIVPWHILRMQHRLTGAFREKNFTLIMKYSAEIGHYISDAHVPLHACSNHNGQYTGQKGIHGLWESRIPEMLAENEFDLITGKAKYLNDPVGFIWKKVFESAAASDTVLRTEKELSKSVSEDMKYSFEERSGKIARQYSSYYTRKYNLKLNRMTERRMREAIFAVASFWFTAWVNAGQPDLKPMAGSSFQQEELAEWEILNKNWKNAGADECRGLH
jgi:hypothetical protein